MSRLSPASSRRRANLFWSLLTLGLTQACNCDDSGTLQAVFPDIDATPAAVNLGDVPFGVKVSATITVWNRGNGMLAIEDIRLTSTLRAKLTSTLDEDLTPNSNAVLQVEVTAPEEAGPYQTDLVIVSNDPDTPELSVPITIRGVPPPPCDDGNVCTEDFFDETIADCAHNFIDGLACSPADKCITEAVCSRGVCLGTPKTCDDNSACTSDFCRQVDGECLFIEDETNCDDNNPCTADGCGPEGCFHEPLPSGSACDDGDSCTQFDACLAGVCQGRGATEGEACDDGDSCTVNDVCSAGVCQGESILADKSEGEVVFQYPLTEWEDRAFLHRREVSLSEDGVFYGLDHLQLPNAQGLTHVVFAMNQCGSQVFEFAYRPPDANVLVSYVRRGIQIGQDNQTRMYVGVRQLPRDGFRPQTTTYVLDKDGQIVASGIQTTGGETGRSLLPDGSNIYGIVWPLNAGPIGSTDEADQNLVVVREDNLGNTLWTHERSTGFWAEFLGVAGPRVLFWSEGRFGALDFNTGAQVWTRATAFITKELALSTNLNLGVARATDQLIGVEILEGREVFQFPSEFDPTYVPRTDPVISSDGRILVLMERRNDELLSESLVWVELDPNGRPLSETVLPYNFPFDYNTTRHEDFNEDPYPTVADDGVAYVGYGDHFFAIDPGGAIRWTLTSTIPNAFTGTVPLLRDDGVLLINENSRSIVGIRTNGGQMSDTGWPSFRHDGGRTNFTP